MSQTEGERHEHTRIDDYIQYAPMAAGLGLGWLGVEARHSGRDRVLLTGTAFCTMTAIAGGLKYTIREERPDKTDNRSFPSGHAARAFMGAELVRMEYGTPLGIAAYGTAIGGTMWQRVPVSASCLPISPTGFCLWRNASWAGTMSRPR